MKIMLRGNAKEFEAPMTALEIAASISHELKKEAVAAKIDGEVKDLKTVIDHDCEVEFLTFDGRGRPAAFTATLRPMCWHRRSRRSIRMPSWPSARPSTTVSTMTLTCDEPFTTDDF